MLPPVKDGNEFPGMFHLLDGRCTPSVAESEQSMGIRGSETDFFRTFGKRSSDLRSFFPVALDFSPEECYSVPIDRGAEATDPVGADGQR